MYRERQLPPNEAQRILVRALELQRAAGGGRELGEEEISKTLRALGVEERLVQRALRDDGSFPAEVTGQSSRFVGAPVALAFERHVGRKLETTDHVRLVRAIRSLAGEDGLTEVLGDELTWTSQPRRQGQLRRLRVTLSSSDEGTTVRVEEDLRQVAGGVFGGILGALGVNALIWSILAPAVFGSGLWLPALLVTLLVGVWAIVRASFRLFVDARRRALAELLDKVAAEAAAEPRRGPRIVASTGADAGRRRQGDRVEEVDEDAEAEAAEAAEAAERAGPTRPT